MPGHTIDFRVYYEDTDAGGVVFYANYLKFAERGRTELLREAGFENRALHEREGVLFVVRRLNADYHRSARLDDLLTVKTSVKTVNNASFEMNQAIFRHDSLLFSMDITLVCINIEGKPVRLSEELKSRLNDYIM
ncbi:MAG: tol-pal system-associated acyl-CoA thioesterase [Micavibrio aeruginosavorus]|nr:tol-pal system-associated acyl-CoA thioesterase [Micavibrio aeruginosavorus]